MRSIRPVVTILLLACLMAPAVAGDETIVNDITRLNPILVDEVIEPRTIEEIVQAVRSHPGPIAIGGGRFSQGGQTATEHALHIDMRRFDKVVDLDTTGRVVTVQTGITWRKLIEQIDPHDLSVRIMQSYANFTVGGSLSVNVHGRYVGEGPLVGSVRSIRIVLADGSLITASPTVNQEVFYGAIGGYGGLGVIVEATLALTDNVRVERRTETMPVSAYRGWFEEHVRGRRDVIFHNADIYPPGYDTMRAVSFLETDDPVTVEDRLMPADRSYWFERLAMRVMSEWPGGLALRKEILDPFLYRGDLVEWRNYEATYDVASLEPVSRRFSTYVLQEYFIPVDRFEEFVADMAGILNGHGVNAINVSIRHAIPDPGTLLAWAREEVFAFVLYYKQGTGEDDREAVGEWTRELIDAAIRRGGTYYLPYQIHATERQFHDAYPRADAFLALKRRLDPENKFRNKLWDAYGPPPGSHSIPEPGLEAAPLEPLEPGQQRIIADALKKTPGYARDEAQTFLTLPEWLLVYYPAEYARCIRSGPPSSYPYFGAIAQFWSYYRDVYRFTRDRYPVNWGYHLMVMTIGTSYTAENMLKGIYENTIGRLSERLAGGSMTQEDRFAAEAAAAYAAFIHERPWYEYSFMANLKQLWAETDLLGPRVIRKWERKLALSAEYLVKAQYAMLIKLASRAAYGDEDERILALAGNITPAILAGDDAVLERERFGRNLSLLSIPRYDAFADSALRLVQRGVTFREIAGNDLILLTVTAPADWTGRLDEAEVLFDKPVLSDVTRKRLAVAVPVPSLHTILFDIQRQGLQLEHIYDY